MLSVLLHAMKRAVELEAEPDRWERVAEIVY